VQTTRNIEKMTRTTREMAEVQRDSYEALARTLRRPSGALSGLPKAGSSS
jgi:hypothetical protein